MKILVCGSRSFDDKNLLEETLGDYNSGIDITIIAGGATGADTLAEQFAIKYKWETVIHLPDWKTHGRSAGFIRNQKMIEEKPDLIIAFWDGKSKGTADTLNRAKKKKISTLIVYY